MRKRKLTKSDFSPWMREIVEVLWEDPSSIGETSLAKLEKEPPMLLVSRGLVVQDDGKRLSIAFTCPVLPRDKQFREILRLPWAVIKDIKILEEAHE